MASMARITRLIWRRVALDKLSLMGCNSAKMFIVGFLWCSFVLVDKNFTTEAHFMSAFFGEGID